MKKKGELISFPYSGIFPINIEVSNGEQVKLHWHPEMELIFVLSGNAKIFVEDTSFEVRQEDVVLINSNDLHQISGPDSQILSLHFYTRRLPYMDSAREQRFDLNSSGDTRNTRFDFIRYLIAQFIKLNSSGEHIYKTLSIVFTIFSHLTENFLTAPGTRTSPSRRNRERISAVIEYMEDHYAERLSLADTAKSQNLSVPYFASYFEKNTGRTFLTYYNEIRLTHAVYSLLTTEDSIEQIALSNGFSDSRAFSSLFKKKYHVLPSIYRKQHSIPDTRSSFPAHRQLEERAGENVSNAVSFSSLDRYLTVYRRRDADADLFSGSPRMIDAGTVDASIAGIGLRHTFHRLMCVGSAKQFLYREVQDMIRMVQDKIHYDYVKFHGLLSDDMMVYTENDDGTPVYTFLLIDKIIDFMLSADLKPFCQFSFMPAALASDPGRMIDMLHYNTSPPKDMKKWTDLIGALMKHLVRRYGIREVKSWLFCVWNEPNETVTEFSWPDRNLFFNFYEQTYRTVKNIDPDFRFGTPSLLLSVSDGNIWADDFFRFCSEHNCQPDFMNIHYYDNSIFQSDMRERRRDLNSYSIKNINSFFPLSADPYAFLKYISHLKHMMKKLGMKNLPIYLSEWNLTISHRDLINDTCFKACYLVKNLLENYDRLESFGYWCLTDFIEELPIPESLYHGGLGMFTYNGIPKAHFNAFRFLNQLDDTMIGKGDGYFITKGDRRITVLLYNYEHYSKLFASGSMMDSSDQNRYAAFSKMNTAQFSIHFTKLPCGTCLIKERFINQLHGSSYDAWIRMGGRLLTGEDDLDLLRQQSQPGLYLHREHIENGTLMLNIQLAPLEVRLIQIEFQEPDR